MSNNGKKLPPKSTKVATASTSQSFDEDAAANFEEELLWCIEHLQDVLLNATTKQSPPTKQTETYFKGLMTLKNRKAPVAKKRQVMHMTCGDYRKKMQEERRRFCGGI